MPAVQSRLDRIVSPERQSRLDRIPGGQTKPNFSLTREPVSSLDVPRQFSMVDVPKETGHGAIEGFAKLPETVARLQQIVPRAIGKAAGLEKDSAFQRSLLALFSGIPGQPPSAHELAQRISPLTEAQHETTATQAGNVLGGLAQLPILGPMGPAATSLAMGVQSGMSAYDEVKANKGSEADAWKAAALQGGLSALATRAMIGIATKFNVNSGGILARIGKNVAAGVPVGAVEQTLSNGLTRYTGEKDRELWTGLKGRAATDAAVGLLMAALFPGHPVPERIQKATAKVELHGPVPDVQLAGMEGVKAVQKPQAATTPEPTPTPAEQPVVEQAKPQAVDPLEKVVQDMTLTQLRIRNLEGQSRVAKQKGQVEKGFRIDKELLGLGQKLRAHAQEFQDLAAERRGPEASGERPASVQQGAAAAEIPAESALSGVQPASSEAVQPTAEPAPVAEPRQASAESAREAAPQPQPTADTELHQALGDPSWRSELSHMAEQAGGTAPGGHPSTDPVTGERIKNYAAGFTDWWDARPGGMSKVEIQRMVAKLVKAPEGTVPDFTQRQMTMLEYMMHNTATSREGARAGQKMAEQMFRDQAASARAEEVDRQRAEFVAANPGKDVPEELLPESATSFDPGTWEDFHSTVEESQSQHGDENAKATADAVTAEARAVAERAGTPPPPAEPPHPDEALPGPGDPTAPDAIDNWIARRQLAEFMARAEGAGWKERLRTSLRQSEAERIAERRTKAETHRISRADEALHTYIDTLGKTDEEFAKYGASLDQKHLDVLERAQKLTPTQREIANEIIASNRENSQAALDAGVITNIVENYVKRLWRGTPQEEGGAPSGSFRGGKPRFITFTTGALPRQYSSVLEGWARGDELKIKGAINASVWNKIVTNQVALDRDLIHTLRKQKLLSNVQEGPDWKAVEHPNFKDWAPLAKIKLPEDANALAKEMGIALGEDVPLGEATKIYGWSREGKHSEVQGRNLRIVPDGQGGITILHKSQLFAPKGVAKDLNNILGRSAIAEYAEGKGFFPGLVRNYYRLNNGIKTIVTIGTQDNQIIAALRNFGAAPGDDLTNLSPRKAYQRGWDQILKRGPEIQELVRDGGLQLTPDPTIAPMIEAEKGRFSKALDGMKIAGPAKLFAENTYREMVQFLYGKYLPANKAILGLLERDRLIRVNKDRLIDGTMTMRDINIAASKLSNSVHSGQNWQRMRSSPTGKDIAQAIIFAPDWTYSTLKTFRDAFRAGATGEAHRALWTRLASRYVIAWTALNLASAFASDPSDPIKEFAKRRREDWKLGLREFLGWDIEPILRRMGRGNQSRAYVNILATFGEPFEAISDPLDYLNRKIAVAPRAIGNALFGVNFFGRKYTTTPELLGIDDKGLYKTTHLPEYVEGMKKGGKLAGQVTSYASDAQPGPIAPTQYPSFLIDQANSSTPIQVQAFTNVLAGQMDAYEAALRAMGLRVIVPSVKRQEKAGIHPKSMLDLEGLFR